MAKKKREPTEREVFDAVVFKAASVVRGPDDMGILEISTNTTSFGVMLNHDNAMLLIRELQDFIEGWSPHFSEKNS